MRRALILFLLKNSLGVKSSQQKILKYFSSGIKLDFGIQQTPSKPVLQWSQFLGHLSQLVGILSNSNHI